MILWLTLLARHDLADIFDLINADSGNVFHRMEARNARRRRLEARYALSSPAELAGEWGRLEMQRVASAVARSESGRE